MSSKYQDRWVFFCTIAILVIFSLLQIRQAKGHSLHIEMDDSQLAIASDQEETVFIPLSEIVAVRQADSLGEWTLTDGTEDANFASGVYHGTLGENAYLCAYKAGQKFLVIQTQSSCYICGLSTEAATEKIYQKLRARLPDKTE